MSAFAVNSAPQVFRRLCTKARHAEPQLRGRRRADRIAASARIAECEHDFRAEIALCIWGAAALSHSVEL